MQTTPVFQKRHAGRLSHQEIEQRYQSGQSAAVIAEADGTAKNSILRVLKKLKVRRRPAHGKAKHGFTLQAKRFGISVGTYCRYLAIKKLGGACVKCGVSDPRVLALNHVNIKKHKIKWSELVAVIEGKTIGVDLRCANCNVLFEHEKGFFPRHRKMIEHLFRK